MKDASTDANITTALEMLVIGMTLASGLVYLAEVWPDPQTPLWFASGAAGIFFVYAAVAAVRDLRKLLRGVEPVEEGGATSLDDSKRGHKADEVVGPDPVESLVIGSPSSDPTQLHSLEALRPETDDDFALEDSASVPLYAESALFDLNKLAIGAKEIQREAADEEDPFEQPTELHSLERLRPETPEEISGESQAPVSPLYAESALRDQRMLAKVAKELRESDVERVRGSGDAGLRAETDDDVTEKGDVEVMPLFAESALHDQKRLAEMARKIRDQQTHGDHQGDES